MAITANLPLIRDPVLPADVDTLIMESTYGAKDHGDPLAAYEELRQVLARTLERGGRVIIPAFAVGRTQEIVYDIHQMVECSEIPAVSVFVDSPLASEATKVFRDHPEYFDDEACNFIRNAESWTALGFDCLRYIQSARDARQLNEHAEPMIILSTSGMLEAGQVLQNVRFRIEDLRSAGPGAAGVSGARRRWTG